LPSTKTISPENDPFIAIRCTSKLRTFESAVSYY
jgi:hypothetical protein